MSGLSSTEELLTLWFAAACACAKDGTCAKDCTCDGVLQKKPE